MEAPTVEIDSKINELFSKTSVTQKIKNNSENPIELKIYVYKKESFIFSSFSAKIGDSVLVKSKVIKKEKAKEKYTDAISSGNSAIFVCDDPENENRIIINMGNIPAKEELTFISEFIQPTESSNSYEIELFRNLPVILGNDVIYQNSSINGKAEIKTKNKICKIEKEILSKNVNIIEEKYLNEEKNNYLIKYEYKNLRHVNKYSFLYSRKLEDYIPSSKIYFDLETKEPIIFSQKSVKDKKEKAYIIQYRNTNINKSEDLKIFPALFIFLIDQSGSMSGNSIKVASKALLLFLQSLPAGSLYQIIGFGSRYKKYDEEPKEYNQENIQKSIKIIEEIKADLGGTNIYKPLKDIYDSCKVYDKILLPKNIFLLTDGEIDDKKDTLSIIEKNNNKFSIYSIGIGNDFDEDLIKNAGIIGKGNYNFCKDINGLNQIIASEISIATSPFISNFNIKTSFDETNLYKINNNLKSLKINQTQNFSFIINNENEEDSKNKDNIEDNKINIEVNYNDYNNEEKCDKYAIEPEEISEGEELFKLIINNYILNDSSKNDDEKEKLALKYQIFSKYTSLFAEIELSEKINEEMKQKIIGDKENNQIEIKKQNILNDLMQDTREYRGISRSMLYDIPEKAEQLRIESDFSYSKSNAKSKPKSNFSFLKSIGNSIKGFFSFGNKTTRRAIMERTCEDMCCNVAYDFDSNNIANECYVDEMIIEDIPKYEIKNKNEIKKEEKINLNLNDKESIMQIINTQDFINGCWDINDKTKIVKEKYEKEFELLKNLKNKNVDDKIAMTIIIIYFISKEHSELLNELIMIIKKGKIFIHDKTKETYEYFIKEIGLSD